MIIFIFFLFLNIGHDVSCDHPLQSPLPCRLLEEVVVCAGDLPSLPQPAERLITARLLHTGHPATRDPGSGSSTASRVRFKPPGSPARRHHSHSSIRPCDWTKRRCSLSCLLLLPVLKPASSQTQLTHCWPKELCCSRISDGKLSALCDGYAHWMLLRHLYNQNLSTVPRSSKPSQNPEVKRIISPIPHLDLPKHQLSPSLYYKTTISSKHQPECDHVTLEYSAVMLYRHLAHIH